MRSVHFLSWRKLLLPSQVGRQNSLNFSQSNRKKTTLSIKTLQLEWARRKLFFSVPAFWQIELKIDFLSRLVLKSFWIGNIKKAFHSYSSCPVIDSWNCFLILRCTWHWPSSRSKIRTKKLVENTLSPSRWEYFVQLALSSFSNRIMFMSIFRIFHNAFLYCCGSCGGKRH